MTQTFHAGGLVAAEGTYVIGSRVHETTIPKDKFLLMAQFMRERFELDPGAEVKIDVRASDYNPNGRVVYAEWTKPNV